MMKNNLSKFIACLFFTFLFGINQATSQVVNQTADWGTSTTWILSGNYNSAALFQDPTAVAKFGYDDDAAGSTSTTDDIELESPIINLTAAAAAGETFLQLNFEYVRLINSSEFLTIEYWDADAMTMLPWSDVPQNSSSTSDYETCLNQLAFPTIILDIASFTPTQLAGFKYRYKYRGSTAWGWGFCINPPTLISCVPPIATFPYCVDFASYLPTFWSEGNGGSPTTGPTHNTFSTWTHDAFGNVGTTGSAKINLWAGSVTNHEWLVSPCFVLTGGGPYQAAFDVALTEYATTNASSLGSDDFVKLSVTTDGGATWTVERTWDNTSTISPTGDPIIVDLTAYSGQTVQFGFVGDDGTVNDVNDTDFFVDNFCVEEIPPPTTTCETAVLLPVVADCTATPTTLDFSNGVAIGNQSCDAFGPNYGFWYSFVAPSSGAVNIYSGGNAFEAAVFNACNTTDILCSLWNSFDVQTISGLTPGETYPIVIWRDIQNGISSLCLEAFTITPDYCEDFTSYPAAYWSEGNLGSSTSGPSNLLDSEWISDVFGNTGSNNAARVQIQGSSANHEWLLSPVFDLSDAPFQAEFDVSLTGANTTSASPLGSDDFVRLSITTDDGVSWTVAQIWDNTSSVSNTGDAIVVDLAAYTGEAVQFGFVADDGSINNSSVDFFIDNFCVTNVCPEYGTYYTDFDGDGYGDINDPGTPYCVGFESSLPSGTATNNVDCDDGDSNSDLNINDNPIPTTFVSWQNIYSTGTVTAGAGGGPVTFEGYHQVVLEPGFVALEGSDFHAYLLPNCPLNSPDPLTEEEIEEEVEKVSIAEKITTSVEDALNIYPNPFQNETTLEYAIGKTSAVTIIVVDAQGTVVDRPIDNRTMGEGVYKLNYNASRLSEGMYSILLRTENNQKVVRMVIVRN